MHDYTIDLALFDYVPIALTAMALIHITRLTATKNALCGQLAGLGGVLIVSGGMLKASWKLIVAASGENIVWMNNALFTLLAPGFFLLGFALAVRHMTAQKLWLALSGSLLIVAIATLFNGLYSEQRHWFFWLLAVTTLSNTVVITLLTRQAWLASQPLAAVLFVLSFVGTLTLSGLARIPEQTASLQWIEESINTLAQFCLLIASLRLRKQAQPYSEALSR